MKSKIQKRTDIIYNSDSRRLLEVVGDVKIKSTITSPPYFDMKDYGSKNQIGFGQSYEQYLEDLKEIFKDVYQITDNDGSLWIIIDSFKRDNQVVTLPFDLSNKLKEIGWMLQDIIIWKKDKTVPWSQKGFVQRKFEYILFFSKSTNFKYNKDKVRNYDTDVLKKWWVKYPERYNPRGKALDEIWEFPIPVQGSWGEKYIRHFCPLPKEMVATMIEISTDFNDVVLDPFAGSGSVPFQSAAMGRKFIGFELNDEYIQMFNDYLKTNIESASREYGQLCKVDDQDIFQKRILDLRALKYGRLLVNDLNKTFNLDLKVVVEILNYLQDSKTHIEVEFKLVGNIPDQDFLLLHVNKMITTRPFSKFGVKPIFLMVDNIMPEFETFYRYTKTNTYSFSDLPINSPLVKVLSQICVNLSEKDYE